MDAATRRTCRDLRGRNLRGSAGHSLVIRGPVFGRGRRTLALGSMESRGKVTFHWNIHVTS
jgi:hypothetical protein